MKILQVMAGGAHGGAETAFVDMCLAMHEAGETIEVVTRANDVRVSRMQKAGIKVHTLRFGGGLGFLTSRKLEKIIRAFQPNIVQTWMSRASLKTPRWNKSMGIAYYTTVARLGSPYKLKYYKNTEFFVPITPDIESYIIDGGIDAARVRQINNFAEVETVEKPVRRTTYDVPEDVPLLLGLGRLHPDKAFDTLIKVVATISDVHLWIAGEGPQRAELEQLIEDLNLADRVKLLGWRTDRAALLQACDICTFISREEGFGTVFVQAWAQKTPVLVSDADGPRQFVRHEEDGLMVPIDDESAMKVAIERMIKDQKLCAKLVENGFKRYEAEFTKEKSLQSYLSWYQDILKIQS